MRKRWVWVGLAAAAVALPEVGLAQSKIVRPGTIGLGAYGSYGTVVGDSRLGQDFQNGGGYGLDLKYVAGPHWSVGLTFQNQIYQPEGSAIPADPADATPDKLVTTGLMFNVYYYRQRGLDVANYLQFGVGYYRPEVHFFQVVNEERLESISFPGESLSLAGGMGIELFIRENWGISLAGKAVGYFGDGVSNEEELATPPVTSSGNISVGLMGHVGLFYYLTK